MVNFVGCNLIFVKTKMTSPSTKPGAIELFLTSIFSIEETRIVIVRRSNKTPVLTLGLMN